MLTLKLIMKMHGDHERIFSMHQGQMTIGRDLGCDLRIPLPQISNTHCRISEQGDDRILESLDNELGTHVNGKRIERTVLRDEDLVRIGPVVFMVSIEGDAESRSIKIHRADD